MAATFEWHGGPKQPAALSTNKLQQLQQEFASTRTDNCEMGLEIGKQHLFVNMQANEERESMRVMQREEGRADYGEGRKYMVELAMVLIKVVLAVLTMIEDYFHPCRGIHSKNYSQNANRQRQWQS